LVRILAEGGLELHHCPKNRLTGVASKAIAIELIDLIPVGENAVSGAVESVDIGNVVTFAVYENLTLIFVE
jgi:hypothetical protein